MAEPQPKRIGVGILLGLVAGMALMLINHLVEGIDPLDRLPLFVVFETIGAIAGAIVGIIWAFTAMFDQDPPANPPGPPGDSPADSS
jgi:hypothetical protein